MSWETPTDTEMTPRIKQVSRSRVLIDASANKVFRAIYVSTNSARILSRYMFVRGSAMHRCN